MEISVVVFSSFKTLPILAVPRSVSCLKYTPSPPPHMACGPQSFTSHFDLDLHVILQHSQGVEVFGSFSRHHVFQLGLHLIQTLLKKSEKEAPLIHGEEMELKTKKKMFVL